MEVLKIHRCENELVLVAGELCGELTSFYVLRVSPRHPIAAKRDGLLYAYRLLSPEEARAVAELLEKLSTPSESDVRTLVCSLLAKGAEWGRRDMPVYRFAGTVIEVSPPRSPRRLLIRTFDPRIVEVSQQDFRARWLPHLKGWLVEAYDWKGVIERVRLLVEGVEPVLGRSAA